ncbi:hypothetical protein HY990_06500 [Candidatus Micrarchaeota archaeon]|nr:hypothetical protein [Candidatus Micrarchaeota archaeon]
MEYTTIQISKDTRERMSQLRINRQTYDDLLRALLDLIPLGDDEGSYTPEFRASLLRGLLDIRHGRTYSLEQAKTMLGI